MLSCKEATRLVSERLDHQLPMWKRLGLRLHVLLCRACSGYKRQLESLDRLVSERYRNGDSNEDAAVIPAETIEKMKASLRSGRPGPDQAADKPDAL